MGSRVQAGSQTSQSQETLARLSCCCLRITCPSVPSGLDSVLTLPKTASVYLISALRGLCKVLSFKNGPSVQKHFLHVGEELLHYGYA